MSDKLQEALIKLVVFQGIKHSRGAAKDLQPTASAALATCRWAFFQNSHPIVESDGQSILDKKGTLPLCMSTLELIHKHLTTEELEAGLDEIRRAPKDEGVLELIVRRPGVNDRQVLAEGELDLDEGLVGDSWKRRRSTSTPDGSPNPLMQLNVMNARVIALVAQEKSRWQLAGDQLFLDLDLSAENLPAGTRLSLGSAIIEVTPPPHLGCQKFVARFGLEAMRFVNSPLGRQLHLRGINAKVVQAGVIRVGDVVRRIK